VSANVEKRFETDIYIHTRVFKLTQVTSSVRVTILKHSSVKMLVCVIKTHLILLSKLFLAVYYRSVNVGLFIHPSSSFYHTAVYDSTVLPGYSLPYEDRRT
jgi:hypothetical protein